MSRPRIGMTGTTGLVGSRVFELLGLGPEARLGRTTGMDLAGPPSKWQVDLRPFDWILHFAAVTDVDRCEAERPQGATSSSWRVNVDGARSLAEAARRHGGRVLLISTDFVFPTTAHGPHPEDATPARTESDTNWYGWTKRSAETEVQKVDPRNVVLRISHPYRAAFAAKLDFARKIVDAFEKGNPYPLFDDQTLTPTFIDDIAGACETILAEPRHGVYHLGSADLTTPHRFGTALLSALGQDASKLPRGRFGEFRPAGRAPRSQHGGLSSQRLQQQGLRIPESADGIARMAKQMAKGPRG